MAKKKETNENIGLVRQFDDMKKKHPDAMLLFRTGDFYELYRQDAVKAAAILAITLTDRIIPGEKEPMKMTSWPDFPTTPSTPTCPNSYAQGRGSPFATRWKTPS